MSPKSHSEALTVASRAVPVSGDDKERQAERHGQDGRTRYPFPRDRSNDSNDY